MKRWLETGTPAAGRLRPTLVQPVTPPIFIRSGMAKSQAPSAKASAAPCGSHQFSPVWIGTGEAARTAAWPRRSSALTAPPPNQAEGLQRAHPMDRLRTSSAWL